MEKQYPQRTPKQNDCLHKWLRGIAEAWNDAGYEQKITIGTVETPWTMESVKIVCKKIVKAMYGKKHTSDLTTKELKAVEETLHRLCGKVGVHVPWPSIEETIKGLQDEEADRYALNRKNKRG